MLITLIIIRQNIKINTNIKNYIIKINIQNVKLRTSGASRKRGVSMKLQLCKLYTCFI